jgi:hypothetical protein
MVPGAARTANLSFRSQEDNRDGPAPAEGGIQRNSVKSIHAENGGDILKFGLHPLSEEASKE